ncbi:MAG: hypothetical protein MK008_09890 [Bdellovibrionales bacterium]|nr:hypothetical protein [Bdellovibrionales bacterium]
MNAQLMVFVLGLLFCNLNYADEVSLNYPELQVTPLASERLENEAKIEHSDGWKTHWSLQVSALATLTSSFVIEQKKYDYSLGSDEVSKRNTDFDNAKLVGQVVGGGWLIGTVLLNSFYEPYKSSFLQNRKMNTDTKRERLSKERHAESTLRSTAKIGQSLKWISVATNLVASAAMASEADADTELYPQLSALLSFMPILFPSRWEVTHDEHEIYKKRIYAPVVSAQLMMFEDKPVSGMGLYWSF